jgi:NTE family protein
MSRPDSRPRIGLALGGGGAKGLAHILALEAFDDAGIRPHAITGTSIGAIIGAAYASGYSARAIRAHVQQRFRDRTDAMARVFRARVGKLTDLFSGGLGNPALVDAERLLDEFWPASMPATFADLGIPFRVVATDFYASRETVIGSGPLRTAVAASMAIPSLVRPVLVEGRAHIDGGATNPLPFDRLPTECDLVIAVDVVGGPEATREGQLPGTLEAAIGASQILQTAISQAKLAFAGPEVRVIRPKVTGYTALDFFSARKILQVAEPIRAEVRALLAP